MLGKDRATADGEDTAAQGETVENAEEGVVPKVVPSPGMPSARDRAIHDITHIPYRSWCDHCVRGRGRNRQHKMCGAYGSSTVSRIHMDYCFFTEKMESGDDGTAAADDDDVDAGGVDPLKKLTALVLKESGCGSLWAYPVRSKGTLNEPWLAKQIVWDMETVGAQGERMLVKSDQESSITDLGREITKLRGTQGTGMEESRVGDHDSNATIEQAVQEVEGMTRTLRSALEGKIGGRLPLGSPVTPWLIRHAAANITRHQVRDDGKTAFQKMKGYNGILPIMQFGETVHFRLRTNAAEPHAVGKFEDRYRNGVYLGYDLRSGESYVGTEEGVFRSGACKRRAEDQQWSRELLEKIIGDPETPVPGKHSGRPPTYTQVTSESKESKEARFVIPEDVGVKVRIFAIRKADVLKHGPSESCAACRCIMMNAKVNRPHTETCRNRFEVLIAEDENGKNRIDRSEQRANQEIVKQSEQIWDQEKKRKLEETSGADAAIEVENADGALVDQTGTGDAMEDLDGAPTSVRAALLGKGSSSPRTGVKRLAEEAAEDPRTLGKDGDAEVIHDHQLPQAASASGASASADDIAMDAMEGTWECQQCQMKFVTRNKLFKHLRREQHYGEASNGSTRNELLSTDETARPVPRQDAIEGTQAKSKLVSQQEINSLEERQWKYVGSGIVARTFDKCKKLVLTTKSGPTSSDIEYRVVRDIDTGKIIDECRPEDTADDILFRNLPHECNVRVELTLKEGKKMFKGRDHDIVEMYSPPRIVQEAGLRRYQGLQLTPGWSMDLTRSDPVTGVTWDFTKSEARQRAWEMISKGKPFLLIGSPPCTAFSSLQNLSKNKRSAEAVQKQLNEGKLHMRFMMKLYAEQARGGRYFLHEHPESASSWALDCVKEIASMPGVYQVVAHMCRFGMTAVDHDGEGAVKKPTRFMTNSREVARSLDKQCEDQFKEQGDRHRHVQLINGRASKAQIYPKQLCQAVCDGVARQKIRDQSGVRELCPLSMDEMNVIANAAEKDVNGASGAQDNMQPVDKLHEPDVEVVAHDDVSGEDLDPKLVQAARKEEIEYFRSMGVYAKVPIKKCLEVTGKRPIQVRWIDINKGDRASPLYRSRLVAKEFNTGLRPDLFAATPPLEGMRLLLHKMATGKGRYKLLYADVSRAYFYARAVRPVFVVLPSEDTCEGEEELCGEL